MLQWVRNLPPYAEFIIVVIISLGGFIADSVWVILTNDGSVLMWVLSDRGAVMIVIHEVIALFSVALFLSVRGWSFEILKFDITWRASFGGLLIVAIYLAIYIISLYWFPEQGKSEDHEDLEITIKLSLLIILIFSIVNPIFEEVIVVGYVMNFIASRHGAVIAIGVSTAIRLLYHLYQGPFALISIVPMGIVFGLIYWRWRNLWPLIIAHGAMNFIVFLLIQSYT